MGNFDPNSLGLGETVIEATPEDTMEIEIEVKFKDHDLWYKTTITKSFLIMVLNHAGKMYDGHILERVMPFSYDGSECSIRCEFVVETKTWEFV